MNIWAFEGLRRQRKEVYARGSNGAVGEYLDLARKAGP